MNPVSQTSPVDLTTKAPIRNSDTLVSVCVIVSDQTAIVENFVRAAVAVLDQAFAYYELLLLDNNSPADVHLAIQQLQTRVANVRLVRLSRRYNPEVAIAAALDHCVGDYVVVMDSMHYPPELLPTMVHRAIEGYDAVVAEPVREAAGTLEKAISHPLYRLSSRVLGFTLQPEESYFRIFSRRLVNALIRIRSKNRSLSTMNGLIGLRRSTVTYQPVPSAPPRVNVARRLVRQLLTLANIVVSNSGIPLRFAAFLGLLASGINLLYLFYILGVTLVKSQIAEGWLTTSLMHTTMFLMLFIIMTILAEYVARILDETKEQPLYFVESESNSTVAVTSMERLNIV